MVAWTEILSESKEELTRIGTELNVHPLALEDCMHRDQRAKLEDYETHQLLVWFMIAGGQSYELQFLVFPDRIVMVPHEKPPQGETWKEFLRLKEEYKDVQHMLYQALDRATDTTWSELQKLFEQIDEFEMAVTSQDLNPVALLTLKRQLIFADFSLSHLPSVAEQIQNFYRPKDDLRWRLRDLRDHCERLTRDIDLYRAQISTSIDLYWGFQAHRTDNQIKKLSLLASVALPLTFWASFWGMNFHAIPYESKDLFYGALAVMGVSVITTMILLVRRGYWSD